ncbi:Inner membrane protein alx [compost metagenome]
MIFSGVIWLTSGFEKFTQFQSAYWIEKALSVDNLFVFILVFGFFKVPKELHHKVLFWGIIGALLFRAIFIFAGVGLINLTYLPETVLFGKRVQINAVLFLFGLFLIYAGIKSWKGDKEEDEDKDFSKSAGARLVYKFFKVSKNFDGGKFFTVESGVKVATPLLVVVTVIEFTDLLFAVDSIPAIFAIAPDDPLILYTSNIFAILGLRALYFLLANFIHMFSLLKYGLAIILSFIGVKMVIAPFYHISSPMSLSIVGGVLLLSVIASLIFAPKNVEVTDKIH